MDKWEYKVIEFNGGFVHEGRLNQEGEEEWELAGMTGVALNTLSYTVVLKRRVL